MAVARTPLETAIFYDGRRQTEIAREVGIEETWFNRIVRGRAVPTGAEKKLIAKALRKRVDELFPRNTDANAASEERASA